MLATLSSVGQLAVGHYQAGMVARLQPAKLAAMEGLYHTEKGAPLYLFGWRLYAIEIGDGWSGYLLARRPVRKGTDVAAVRMTERLFVSYSSRRS